MKIVELDLAIDLAIIHNATPILRRRRPDKSFSTKAVRRPTYSPGLENFAGLNPTREVARRSSIPDFREVREVSFSTVLAYNRNQAYVFFDKSTPKD